VLPRGLDLICVSIVPQKIKDGAIDGMVCKSFNEETNVVTTKFTNYCGDQRQVQDRCPQFPLHINKNPCCCAQSAAITLSPGEAALIYFQIFAMPPTHQPPQKKL